MLISIALANYGLLASAFAQHNSVSRNEFRQRFDQALENEKDAKRFLAKLQQTNPTDSALVLAYRCATLCALARHSNNPFTMAKDLYQAKKWIEKAIELKPTDFEIRFLRFAIESQVPGWLAIGTHIETDIGVIANSFNQKIMPTDTAYVARVSQYIIKKANLSPQQQKIFEATAALPAQAANQNVP